ncbi:hypothetical protein [Litorihabitans aurantiacus]|nr:hypothetical protein [Litorihabitans aurantiacus]
MSHPLQHLSEGVLFGAAYYHEYHPRERGPASRRISTSWWPPGSP